MREALRDSLNVPAVSVLYAMGPDRLVAALRNAGATLAVSGDATLPVALGGAGTTLLDLTMLYAALADGGVAMPPLFTLQPRNIPQRPISPAQNSTGNSAVHDTAPAASTTTQALLSGGYRLMTDAAAWQVIDILRDSPRPQGYLAPETGVRPVAFKTGTSYGYRDAWAVGASPD